MKNAIILFLFLCSLNNLVSQIYIIRTNFLSNIRPCPTANLQLGYSNNTSFLEPYLSLEKAYSAIESIAKGQFLPNNSKLNLEIGLGLRAYLTDKATRRTSFFFFVEAEHAKLHYLYKEPNLISSTNWLFGSYYYTDGIVNVTAYKFNRFQTTFGCGFHIKRTKSISIDITSALWLSNHSDVEKNFTQYDGGQEVIDAVDEAYNPFNIFGNYSLSEKYGASDSKLDKDHDSKIGFQLGICLSWTFGKK